jgi:peptide/nickel transport system permease protein
MITEAILSFIGAGRRPTSRAGQHHGGGEEPLSGRGLADPVSRDLPALTVLAVNLVGDGMRDALDPRLARRM